MNKLKELWWLLQNSDRWEKHLSETWLEKMSLANDLVFAFDSRVKIIYITRENKTLLAKFSKHRPKKQKKYWKLHVAREKYLLGTPFEQWS